MRIFSFRALSPLMSPMVARAAIQVRAAASLSRRRGGEPFLSRQRFPQKRRRVRDAMQIHLLSETCVLPLAQWSSMSSKCNSTSFPTSVHIFRSWGGLRLCSCKWKTTEGSPASHALCVFLSLPLLLSVWVCVISLLSLPRLQFESVTLMGGLAGEGACG